MKNEKRDTRKKRQFHNSFRRRNFKKRGHFSKNNGKKELDHKLFIKEAKPIEETKYTPDRSYAQMNLDSKLHKALEFKKFEYPTEIQDKTIDHSISGKNILGIANTGTGKTGAFLIPIIDRLLKEDVFFQSLVIVPTRELATQVQKDFISMTKNLGFWSVCLVGGTPTFKDVKKLRMKNHIIIGTPGRLIDMVKRGALKLNKTEILVLDEFDRMLDMGFVDDVKFLMEKIQSLKQTMLFSATLNKKLEPIIDSVIKEPHRVMVNSGLKTSENIEQNIVRVKTGESKFDKLLTMIKNDDFDKVIIFAETKRAVDLLNKNLRDANIKVEYIHGDKPQRAREYSLKNFKIGKADVLVATDVAARGLDIKGVTHIINYETPRDYESYIHRIGRAGRAGNKGYAFTFVK